MNIVEVIREAAARFPEDQIALRYEAGEVSYEELFRAVDRVAGLLADQGVTRPMRVGLAFPDGADYIILSLALLSLGAVLVPVPVSSLQEMAEEILEKTSAVFLIRPPRVQPDDAVRIRTDCLPVQNEFVLQRYIPTFTVPDEFKQLDPAFIRFSSGTTGFSKGVLLTHQAILERTSAADQALQISSSDTILWVLSMSFHFVVSILLFLRRGAVIWLCGEAFPFSFLAAVARGGGTFIYATPFHYRTLMEAKAIHLDTLRGIRMAVSTAMKLSPEIAFAFEEKFGFKLTEAYGIIEVGLPFVNSTGAKPKGSVGRVLPGFELTIRGKDASGAGEVLLRGPGMYTAYLYPWRLRAPDEWFETGDMGCLDQDGFLYLLGRSKEIINFAGMKVFPYEVEEVLERFPGVRAARVYAEDHPLYGQLPCAQVEGEKTLSGEEILRHCYEHLVSYKVPKKVEIVPFLKRTGSGKIRR